MFKFRGFKASLNFYNGLRKPNKHEEDGLPSLNSVTGAYRTNRDEFFGYSETQRKTAPSVVPPPVIPPPRPLRHVKSTSNLIKDKNLPENLRLSNPGISEDPRGAEQNDIRRKSKELKIKAKQEEPIKLDAEKRVEKQRLEEQKKLEKQRIAEENRQSKERLKQEKKQEKLALKERAKEKSKNKKKNKRTAPGVPSANPQGQTDAPPTTNNTSTSSNTSVVGVVVDSGQPPPRYNTNTLDSSISRSSGPPPYPGIANTDPSVNDFGNVSFSKPIDTSSWDMISQHREQINRPISSPTHRQKQTTMDLNYKLADDYNNSEA